MHDLRHAFLDPLTNAVPGTYGAGTAGAALGNLDATVSSRLATSGYTAPDNADIATLVGRLTSTRAANLDNLDATISSRLATSGYTAPDNADVATLVARLTLTRAANLDNLDVAVSSRLAASGYTAPPTAAQNADALLDRADAIETGLTPRGALRLSAAALAGVLSGAGTTTVTIDNAVASSKPRITATVDSNGNRTAITTDTT